MAEQPNISQILAALAAQRPGGTPTQNQVQPTQQQSHPGHGYPPSYPPAMPQSGPPSYGSAQSFPPPTNSGSIDLSNIKPVNSGSVSLADAVTRARGIAESKGMSYNAPIRDTDPRMTGHMYRPSRSRSRSPSRMAGHAFRDNYNPYRDERRGDPRQTIVGFGRERSFSPTVGGHPIGSRFTPPPSRDFGGPGDNSPMRLRGGDDNNVETISIESGFVGLIIGRQGENLRRVEADTQTRVQFVTGPESSGPTRQCKITGTRAAREDAKAEIYRIIEDNGNAVGATTGRAPPPLDRNMGIGIKTAGANQPALRVGEDASQIMVPSRTVGLIIGRGGETIRDLQERSGCHVNIVGEEKSVNGLRPVNLLGTPQAAAMAKELIMEIVESDTKNMASQGGMSQVRGGAMPLGGDSEKINDRIIVPSDAVGMIIGKGGETIKDMQATTGCKINVSPATGQDFERDIGLVGTRDSIERAKGAITEKVRAVQEKNRSGGGPQRGEQYQDQTQYSQKQQQPYGQQNAQVQAGDIDPYAAYGGYQNYVALWYSSLQANQGQQVPPTQGPPGS